MSLGQDDIYAEYMCSKHIDDIVLFDRDFSQAIAGEP